MFIFYALISWLTGSIFHWFTKSLVQWFTGSLILWFSGSLIHWFICLLYRSLPDSLIHWLIGSLVHFGSCAWILSCQVFGIRWFITTTLRSFCISNSQQGHLLSGPALPGSTTTYMLRFMCQCMSASYFRTLFEIRLRLDAMSGAVVVVALSHWTLRVGCCKGTWLLGWLGIIPENRSSGPATEKNQSLSGCKGKLGGEDCLSFFSCPQKGCFLTFW